MAKRIPKTALGPVPPYRAQLATLEETPPEGDAWIHELKFDGYRIGIRIDGDRVELITRNGNDWTSAMPELADAARRLGVRQAILDGEAVVLLPDGRTSFQALQNALSIPAPRPLAYFAFDLLYLDGEDLTPLPLEERKRRLRALLARSPGQNTLRYSEHFVGSGKELKARACDRHLEGIVSKRRDAPYSPGRQRTWLKFKCGGRQEFVVAGFTDPEGKRAGLGALLVGFYDRAGALHFAGKVGTGFTNDSARRLRARLDAIETRECPFATRPAGWLGRNAHWVQPRLVAEVAFAEWTNDGKIRHPSFKELRADKAAREVVRELPSGAESSTPAASATPPASPASPVRAPAVRTRKRQPARGGSVEVAGVVLSTPERVLFPELGLTKLDLARFYESIADWILPHLEGRPLTLLHCPEGLGGPCGFMKHSKVWAPDAVRRVRIPERTKVGEYLIVDTLPALISLVQMNVLELHTWNSRVDRVEHPDRIVIDLDPGPQVPWGEVVEAARLVRSAFEALRLRSFVKTTGGVGLHVVVPLAPERDWSECLAFARGFAQVIEQKGPELYTTALGKAGREDKILLDYLRNNRTNTSVAAFSTRASARAPISVPLDWDELGARIRSDHYDVRNLPRRLRGLARDPWADYWGLEQRISGTVFRALAARGGPPPPHRRA